MAVQLVTIWFVIIWFVIKCHLITKPQFIQKAKKNSGLDADVIEGHNVQVHLLALIKTATILRKNCFTKELPRTT